MNTREIKFRAWDKKFNTWFNGNVFYLMSQVADTRDDEFIYQQYTGLKDKNNGSSVCDGRASKNVSR